MPGIGWRREFATEKGGRRIGVVEHRDGAVDLIVSKSGNPEAAEQISLSAREVSVLANLLGAPQLVARLQDEHRDLDGVTTTQISLRGGSVYDGRTLGETKMRTRTKASVVAVVRAGQPIASPGPEFALIAGDVLVVVGTDDGLDAAANILRDG